MLARDLTQNKNCLFTAKLLPFRNESKQEKEDETMTTDSDIQVWLETFAKTQPVVIVPYVSSTVDVTLRYKLRTVKQSNKGKSIIGQGGVVAISANVPAALSRMSLNTSPNDECQIDLVLSQAGSADRRYHFDCPH